MTNSKIKQLKFLIIDDASNFRKVLKSLLKEMGIHHIHSVADTRTALRSIEEREYDVILCDYDFGKGQNGQQFLEEIMHRKMIPYGTIFIMVTAENMKNMVMAAIESRPDAYLNKPFPNNLLIHRLEKLLLKKEILKPIYAPYNEKDYISAIKQCDIAMDKHPKVAFDIGKLKGEIAIAAKDFTLAENIYDKALSYRPFDWAQYGKAKTLFYKQEYLESKELLLDLIDYNKHFIEAYDLLAAVYDTEEDYFSAQEILNKATVLSPKTVLRQQNLAKIALKNNDFEIAEDALNASIMHGKHSYHGKVNDHTELAKLYINMGEMSKAASVIEDAKEYFAFDRKSLFHASIIESIVEMNLGKINDARNTFIKTLKNIPGEIITLPKDVQDDLLLNSEILGEEDITKALKDDISGNNLSDSGNSLEKYKFLLINANGKQLYQEHKIFESIKLFEHAAQNLSEDISINMNAAQAIIMSLKDNLVINKLEAKELKVRARKYLDISQSLDKNNDKFLKLEALYNEL